MKFKKTFFFLFGTAFLVVAAVFVLDYLAERKINSFLASEMGPACLDYSSLDANVLFGNVEIHAVSYTAPGLKISLEKLKVSDFHYLDFLLNEKIVVEKILLDSPKITQYSMDSAQSTSKKKSLKKAVLVKKIRIENGSFASLRENGKDTLFRTQLFSAEIDSVTINSKTLSRKIPFAHGDYSVEAERIYFDMNQYHEVWAEYLLLSNKNISLEKLVLAPKYTRSKMRSIIPYEKDRFHLTIDSLNFETPIVEFMNENPVFESPLLRIDGVHFEIYRDKTVRDDPRIKKMYSKMLRDLEVKLAIKKTVLTNVYIKYQERLKPGRQLGTVDFHDLGAVILNLTNQNLEGDDFPKTTLDIHTKFMNTTDLRVHWLFDVSNEEDRFAISGSAGNIPPEAMNPFFVPAMHIKAKGNINAVYFNFGGNYTKALGDMRMDYGNFTVEVLKENGAEKNKFLSAIANVFVKKNPKNGTVTKEGIEVVRDRTKSFWNYFWSCIEAGLLKSVL